MPHERLGEGVCAFVIPHAQQRVDVAVLSAFLEHAGMAKQKFPERVELVEDLPRTASGKVQKNLLRERIAQLIEQEKRGARAMSSMPTREELAQMYRRMLLIRRMEERLGEVVKSGELPGPVHLYIGQEAIAVGVCAHLTDRDWIASTHRGHGHFLAKGGDPRAMIAEILGRDTGICRGKGGSMHVADFSRGILGANGIVGGGVGLALGAALAAQLDGERRVSVVFFGDGGANQGVIAEALNMAAIWKLPLLLVCENNGFSEFSPTATVTAGEIAARAQPFGVPGFAIDGNDVQHVWGVAGTAVARARNGDGPTLIEARTYRWRSHVETEASFLSSKYREEEEIARWRQRDPIERLRVALVGAGLAQSQLDAIAAQVDEIVQQAFTTAAADPLPAESSAFIHMLG
jgi:pyruvate dehydrogenase E1 component alpha subunit